MKHRGAIVVALLVCAVAAVVWRLAHLQIVEHATYLETAGKQQRSVVTLEAPRGTIYDARGRRLAVSVEAESAFADPGRVRDPAAAARRLAPVLGGSPAVLARRLAGDSSFVFLKRQLDPPEADRIRALEVPGVGFIHESKRYYPLRGTAAQILGFAGVDRNGLAGLESFYESIIAGTPVERALLRDARQDKVAPPEARSRDPEPGLDLYLTLDAAVQHFLEQALERAVERHGAKGAKGVVLDPTSGAILAMAAVPSFDPNAFREYGDDERRNRVVTDAFEPGSTFKVITAAAALESNIVDPLDVVDCQHGEISVGRTRIRDHKPFGLLTFHEVIAKSSNVGAIKTGLRVGSRRLHRQMELFGFGRPTGVDLPGEGKGSLGRVAPLEEWSELDLAYISFGQGFSVTALQLTAAVAAIANGGVLYQPFVAAAAGSGGEVRPLRPEPVVRAFPIGAATARSLERLMEAVVEEGTGKRAAIPGYRVAGKTGTAQKAIGGRYSPDKFLASFVGFAPARDPAVVCLVAIDEPAGAAYHGGDVAAPVFAEIVGRILVYLGIPPQRPELQLAGTPGP